MITKLNDFKAFLNEHYSSERDFAMVAKPDVRNVIKTLFPGYRERMVDGNFGGYRTVEKMKPGMYKISISTNDDRQLETWVTVLLKDEDVEKLKEHGITNDGGNRKVLVDYMRANLPERLVELKTVWEAILYKNELSFEM